MSERPRLETERLLLRPFVTGDAVDVQRLAGDREIASMTVSIPHPYEDGMAEEWIAGHQKRFDDCEVVNFAITLREGGELVGSTSLMGIHKEWQSAELGYWIGKEYWNKGYATEASRAVIGYGFEVMGLNRVHAHHMMRNPASGRVMEKLGMKQEGLIRQGIRKWGVYEDVGLWAVLKEEWGEDGE